MHFSTEVPEKNQAKVAKIVEKLGLLEDMIKLQQDKMLEMKHDKVKVKAAWITFETIE